LTRLFGIFDANGSSSSAIPPDRLPALSARWLAFIDAHNDELGAGTRLSLDRADIPADLVPAGWTLHRTGKPDWPGPRADAFDGKNALDR
jgi:hypothetical protein